MCLSARAESYGHGLPPQTLSVVSWGFQNSVHPIDVAELVLQHAREAQDHAESQLGALASGVHDQGPGTGPLVIINFATRERMEIDR